MLQLDPTAVRVVSVVAVPRQAAAQQAAADSVAAAEVDDARRPSSSQKRALKVTDDDDRPAKQPRGGEVGEEDEQEGDRGIRGQSEEIGVDAALGGDTAQQLPEESPLSQALSQGLDDLMVPAVDRQVAPEEEMQERVQMRGSRGVSEEADQAEVREEEQAEAAHEELGPTDPAEAEQAAEAEPGDDEDQESEEDGEGGRSLVLSSQGLVSQAVQQEAPRPARQEPSQLEGPLSQQPRSQELPPSASSTPSSSAASSGGDAAMDAQSPTPVPTPTPTPPQSQAGLTTTSGPSGSGSGSDPGSASGSPPPAAASSAATSPVAAAVAPPMAAPVPGAVMQPPLWEPKLMAGLLNDTVYLLSLSLPDDGELLAAAVPTLAHSPTAADNAQVPASARSAAGPSQTDLGGGGTVAAAMESPGETASDWTSPVSGGEYMSWNAPDSTNLGFAIQYYHIRMRPPPQLVFWGASLRGFLRLQALAWPGLRC